MRQRAPPARGRGFERLRLDRLVAPTVRSHVEAQLELVARGTARRAQVVQHTLDEFAAKFAHFSRRIGALNELLESSFGGGSGGSGSGGGSAIGDDAAGGSCLCRIVVGGFAASA